MSYFIGGSDHYTSYFFKSLIWGELDRFIYVQEFGENILYGENKDDSNVSYLPSSEQVPIKAEDPKYGKEQTGNDKEDGENVDDE